MVLLVLALLWCVVLIPGVIRAWATRRAHLIADFERQLGALDPGDRNLAASLRPAPARPAPARPGAVGRGPASNHALRSVLGLLLAAAAASLATAIVVSARTAWSVHLMIDDLLLAYIAVLVRRRDLRARPAPARAVTALAPAVASPGHVRPLLAPLVVRGAPGGGPLPSPIAPAR